MRWLSERSPLRVRTFRRLFGAQVVALVGTGLATVALALLAFELAPRRSGQVLGTVLAIKMVAYVMVSLLAPRLAQHVSARRALIGLDIARALVVVALPWVSSVTEVYALIFLLSACSAAFTPTFQAVIPHVLEDDERYTRALALSRLAFDLESLVSPLLAAAMLALVEPRALFVATALSFVASALAIGLSGLGVNSKREAATWRALRCAARTFWRTPRLRAVLAFNVVIAAAGAMVIVNSVRYVRELLGLGASELAIAMGAMGCGSMLVALALPRLVGRIGQRRVMSAGALACGPVLLLGALRPSFAGLLGLWLVIGACLAAMQTPIGSLLTRSSHAEQRPSLFALQFSLSHLAWGLAYGVAGWLPREPHVQSAFVALGLTACAAGLLAVLLWRGSIDELHPRWPDGAATPTGR